MSTFSKVMIVGLDGLEPSLVEPMLAAGELPNLAKLRAAGGFARIATTYPAQTPVAWSTFATGTNPGGHGIFDFIRRNPQTYAPDLALNRYEQKNAFVPPKAVNLRRGTPLWSHLSAAGVASSVIRCPCTYPPDDIRGRMLSGMGVPDLRGGLGTGTFYTSAADAREEESENLVRLQHDAQGRIATHVIGPRNPKTRGNMQLDVTIELRPASRSIVIRSEAQPRELEVVEGQWSDWLKVKFKAGMFQSVRGLVRFFLVRQEPVFELYASPVNFDAQSPLFPISHPAEYAKELEQQVGSFYTTGMVEDHTGLSNGRFDEAAYLQQCDLVLGERERMMHYELDRLDAGLLFCLFDTPDRIQHMFWRFGEPDHPANKHGRSPELAGVIREHYRQCDAIVGRVLERADERTLVIVLSDHGFNSFQRGMHLNTWLHDHGFLALKGGAKPGAENKELFQNVDWSRTSAYALGLSGIYLNINGREGQGVVTSDDAPKVQEQIAAALAGAVDPARGVRAVNGVSLRQQIYSGPYANEAPDLVVNFSRGYRVSWPTALGGIPDGHFEDNTKRWSGDHIIDPSLVPGVLFMNRPFDMANPRLLDMAPTILASLGVPKATSMEGRSLLL